MRLGDFGTDLACILQHAAVRGIDKTVQSYFPILHGHGHFALRHVFSHIQISVDQTRQLRHFRLGQVIFGDRHVEFLDLSCRPVLPGAQPHVGLVGVCTVINNLGRRLPMDGPMQLVLHGGKKPQSGLRRHIVVNRCGINVGDLLVELALGEPNLTHALQLLFKILLRQDGPACLDALVIHHVGFDGELLDDACGPFAELHRPLGIDLVANGDDGTQVVVLCVIALAIGGSYSKFSNN